MCGVNYYPGRPVRASGCLLSPRCSVLETLSISASASRRALLPRPLRLAT